MISFSLTLKAQKCEKSIALSTNFMRVVLCCGTQASVVFLKMLSPFKTKVFLFSDLLVVATARCFQRASFRQKVCSNAVVADISIGYLSSLYLFDYNS